MRDAALYIHVPFCRHKCIYCDFYSITSLLPMPEFVSGLIKEIELYSVDPYWQQCDFSTVFLGGGTPSLLSSNQFVSLSNAIESAFHLISPEFSCETNPGTLDTDRLKTMRETGINRLIIGAQSFQDNELEFLQRIHTPAQIKSAFSMARKLGYDNVGLDLIFGIPSQTLESWQESLCRAIDLYPEHLSIYGLTFEPHTVLSEMLRRNTIERCDEELEREMYLMACQYLDKEGYEQYEISNFSKPGRKAKHNIKYWDGSPYLGLGPSAHSYLGSERFWNVSDVDRYIDLVHQGVKPVEQKEILDSEFKEIERVMLGLRQNTGIDLQRWQQDTGRSLLEDPNLKALGIDDIEPFKPSHNGALLTCVNQRLCLTRQGLLLYDSVCEHLVQ